MIKLFSTTDNLFSSNGDKVILPLKAKIHKEDNGSFYLDLETNLDYVDDLTANRIIVANTPQGEQAFRITNVEQTRKKISAKCYHVFYDSNNYLITDSYVVDKNCNDALDHLNNATDNTSPFTTLSDITKINSFRCVRKSLYEAIQTVLERWGGHLVRDNFNIKIMSNIGVDNGVTVRYAKNLKELTCEENWDNVVTKLLPVGKNGILLNDLDASQSIYMTSDKQWEIPYTKTVSFEQNDIEQDNYQDETAYKKALIEDLKEQARRYLEENCVPHVNYTMKANLEKVTDIGDTVQVIDERLKLNLTTNVIAFEYDCILDKYTEIEFGNFKRTLSEFASSIVSSASQSAKNEFDKNIPILSDTVTQNIIGSFSSSYVQYDGTKILILDSIPLETAKNVILINNNGIAFSNSGINGTFTSAWSIDGTLNMQAFNVINLICDMIKGGTLKLGSNLNQNGQIEVYDEANNLIAKLDKNGLIMYGLDGSYNGKNVYKSLFYSSGETVTTDIIIYTSGTLISGGQALAFTVFLPKSFDDIESITINELKLNACGGGNYTFGGWFVDGGYDVLTDNTIDVSYGISKTVNALTIRLGKKSGTFNGKNNTAQAIEIDKLKFTCN